MANTPKSTSTEVANQAALRVDALYAAKVAADAKLMEAEEFLERLDSLISSEDELRSIIAQMQPEQPPVLKKKPVRYSYYLELNGVQHPVKDLYTLVDICGGPKLMKTKSHGNVLKEVGLDGDNYIAGVYEITYRGVTIGRKLK